jgi:hypothetical protein
LNISAESNTIFKNLVLQALGLVSVSVKKPTKKFHACVPLTLFYPAVGGIFDQTDGGWEECQKPDADPVNLKITIRCLAPPPALIVEWKGKIKDRWGARFCKYTSFFYC